MRALLRLVVPVLLVVAAVTACDPRPPEGTAVLHRINVGGGALDGGWAADTAAVPSPYLTSDSYVLTSHTSDPISLEHGSMPPGVPAELFRTQRVGLDDGAPLRYDLPVPAGAEAQVRVYLAETRHTAAGLRRFDILIEGAPAFDEVDVFSRSGGHDRAMVLWRKVTSDGSVTVELPHGSVGDPSVAGIEVVSLTALPSPDIAVSPTTIHFRGPYTTQVVAVTNTAAPGSAALEVGEPYLTGFGASAFGVSGGSVTLLPGESALISVGIGDTLGMDVEAQLVIPSNDPDEPTVTVQLSN